jgi:hypothetical protein
VRKLIYLTAISLGGFFSLSPRSEEGSSPIIIQIYPQRQAQRRQSRWTLESWLKTKGEMERQNRWLQAHTNKVPMDLTLGWDLSQERQGFEVDYYLMKAGLRFRYEDRIGWMGGDSTAGIDNQLIEIDGQLRLFGGSIQDTNLIVRGSYEYNKLRGPDGATAYYTGFGFGPELQIYFSQWLGIRGDYKKLLTQETRFRDRSFNGSAYAFLGFLEMGSLRTEFGYRSKTIEFLKGANGSETESGYFGRLRLFF